MRLQADPAWRADGVGLVVDTPELKVVEDRGNVFGFLVAPNGNKCFFRFRFNFQNGSDTPDDGLDMPTNLINSEFVSYNNLRSGTGQRQYRAVPSGGGRVASHRQQPVRARDYQIYSVHYRGGVRRTSGQKRVAHLSQPQPGTGCCEPASG
ncbi:MAG TPA: hypothetical protein EYO33_19045 [Phycisphaerales bacterium]|nr:hypothetical protein [Phycisphaerales bacterium]